jgi:phospholipid N-methyltransferase
MDARRRIQNRRTMKDQLQQTLLFARTFIKHPIMLGSAIPSSRYLTEKLLNQVDWSQARTIVEYGPGVGTLTWPMLRRMRPDAQLIAIERNNEFADYLTRANVDPRLRVVHGSAENVAEVLATRGLTCADCIVSGIPYSTMPVELRQKILRESCKALCPEGSFLVYQFTGAVLPHLRQVFSRVRQDFELRNILPARIFHCAR